MMRTETQDISLFMFLAWGWYSSSNDQDEGTESTVVVHPVSGIHIIKAHKNHDSEADHYKYENKSLSLSSILSSARGLCGLGLM